MKKRIAGAVVTVFAMVWGVWVFAGRNLWQRVTYVRYERTQLAMARVIHALERHRTRTGAYPVASGTVASVRKQLEPYMSLKEFWGTQSDRDVPVNDGWGRPLRLVTVGPSYCSWSYTRDGIPDSSEEVDWKSDKGFDGDLVAEDGERVRFPPPGYTVPARNSKRGGPCGVY